jgi:PAS domain S-box-containing protein
MNAPGRPGEGSREEGGILVLQLLALAVLALAATAVIAGWTRGSGAGGEGVILDPWIHVGVEALVAGLALVVGGMVLVLYRARGRTSWLFLAAGFLATGVLDGWHALVSAPPVPLFLEQDPGTLSAWSWFSGRILLALFLVGTWWFRPRNEEETASARGFLAEAPVPASLLPTAGGLVLLLAAWVVLVPLPEAVHPTAGIPRPVELLPALLFGVALLGILGQGGWRRDPFEQGLVHFLLLSAFGQAAFAAFSADPFDALALGARLLKGGAYGLVVVGLLLSTDRVFRRDREAQRALAEAHAALRKEADAREASQRQARETEARLVDFLENANDLVHSAARDGRILYANRAWRERLGYSDAEIDKLRLRQLVHPSSMATFEEATTRLFRGEAVSQVQVTLVARDGSPVHLSGSANCRMEDGVPVATRTIFRDVSEERRREAAMARMEANLRAVFESTGDPIWSVDPRGRLVTFNTAFALLMEVITGKAPERGASPEELMSTEASQWFRACYRRALAGERFSATRTERLADEVRSYDMYFNPVETSELGAAGVVVFARDATRRHRAEAELRQAKRQAEEASETKSHFLASMSHELRTPLNSIIGFSSVILKGKGGELPERERSFVERIQANGRHLLSLINEILDLSRIEAGKMELHLEPVEVDTLVRETVRELEVQVADRPVRLRADAEGPAEPVVADRARLKQVIINLVGNALKFTESGEVVVHLDMAADGRTPAAIRVRDTGIGIPEDRLEAIFQAFEQAESGTARRFGGTGLGLAISRSLCILMGFDLTARSEVGEGSEFIVAFPKPSPFPGDAP